MTWRERIAAARERGEFSYEEKLDAAAWTSCAVGEQHAIHPDIVFFVQDVFFVVVPNDMELLRLGMYTDMPHGAPGVCSHGFAWAIEYNLFDEAERLLDAIEDRVLELKRGQGSHVES